MDGYAILGVIIVELTAVIIAVALLALRARCASNVRIEPSRLALQTLFVSLSMDFMAGFIGVAILSAAIQEPGWVILGPALLALISFFPYPLARAVFVPLGFAPTAYWLATLSHWSFWRDRRAAGVAIGAWAWLHHPRSVSTIAFLEQQLAGSVAFSDVPPRGPAWLQRLLFFVPPPSRVNALLAGGLLSACRGDADGARACLERIDTLPRLRVDAEARRLALEWRCADAVERGDWTLLTRLESEVRSPMSRFLCALAHQMLDDAEAPSAEVLRGLWQRAGKCAQTRVLLDRANARERRDARPKDALPSGEDEALRRALAGHLSLSRASHPAPAPALRGLASLWDGALLDPALRRSLAARATDLGVPGGVAVLDDLASQVEQQLTVLAQRDGIVYAELQAGGATLRKVARRIRTDLLGQLESSLSALKRRVEDDRRLPGEAELREFGAMRDLYFRIAAFGGMELRRLAFSMLHTVVCSLGVWLWNERRQRRIANAIFRFLFLEAMVLDEESALMLQARNVRAGA